MATTEERLSYLEGGYEHLSTKADLFQFQMQLQAQFDEKLNRMQTRLVTWMIGIISVAAALIIGYFQLLG